MTGRVLAEGARQLPLRHLSIRVPWNDTGWTGAVCKRPQDNISCLILPRVREKRNDGGDEAEKRLAGQPWQDLATDDLPPCFDERGHFMAPYELIRERSHPYSAFSEGHKHFLSTPLRHPPYSAACLPFRWMLQDRAPQIAKELDLGLVPDLEDEACRLIGFDTDWVQTKHNQLTLLDTFFSAIEPQASLCFFYAKRTPLVDDTRRVLVGAGWVTHVGEAVEYLYGGPGPLQSVLWERTVQHSVRPSFSDGFLLPYHQVLDYLGEHPDEEPRDFVAFVSDEQFSSFSYASEHVTNDGAIASLLSCAKALDNIQRIIPGPWDGVMRWISERLGELWKMRGPCPGLGAALTAFGVEHGVLVAHELELILAEQQAPENGNPWSLVDRLLREPGSLRPELHSRIGDTLRLKWKALPAERRTLLQLLSRFELTVEQATRFYVHEDKLRDTLRIDVTDAELLANPYLLYELDRVAPEPVILSTVDRGLFPDRVVRDKFPLRQPSRVDDATDARRVRAFVVRQLEAAAVEGDTLRPQATVTKEIRGLDVQPPCPVDGDLMAVLEEKLSPTVHIVHMAGDGQFAYQLDRLRRVGQVINRSVQRRLKGKRHEGAIPWRELLDAAFGGKAPEDDEEEEDARTEKAAALEELFASRLSVLIGPAGTGKTTLLKVLCHEPEVKGRGVLLLAPTGKARVRMEDQIGVKGAQTLAQFLRPLGRYDPLTHAYHLSDNERIEAGRTVVIDEASMLTEEQVGAVLDALKKTDRLILVGDPQQLPPIGAGRPFLDIVRELEPERVESIFPRTGPGYAELTVRRRQKGRARDDLLLAEWFSGRPVDAGADEIWTRIQEDEFSKHLRFVRWDTSDELQEKLLSVLVEELGLDSRADVNGFEQSLGGILYEGTAYFWAGRQGKPGACAEAEAWQVLSPVRGSPHGVEALNRHIQSTFRSRTRDFANQRWGRKIPKPMGRQGILYGDKVINVENRVRDDVWPTEDAFRYVANGEIGIAVGQFKTKNAGYKGPPWKLEVEFSSQPGFRYGYGKKRDFGEEAEPALELAYALTIHKAQGSEFGVVLVVLPNPCRLLMRELLYTALTRQEDRVVILHQGDRHDLKRYSVDYYSESARRLTNLFRAPDPAEVRDRLLEEGLIHITRRGDTVRSKSEVIIADLLCSKGIDYTYELRLSGKDGGVRYPDFTIEDDESGQVVYWEHLGLMRSPTYRRRWEEKLKWYGYQRILPLEEGGGPNGTLIVTQDDIRGGINVEAIEQLVDQVFG